MAYSVMQVGVGGFGKGWRKVLADAGRHGVELAGVVDVNEAALDEARRSLGLPDRACHVSVDEALAAIEPDLVVCVTPPQTHEEVVLAALAAGAHVICEKPLSTGMESARRMVEAAEAAGRTLAVSQNYRYQPEARAIRDVIAAGKYGAPGALTVTFARGPRLTGTYHRHMAYPMIVDMCVHHYDLMRALLGREPAWTVARSFNPPWSWFDGAASLAQVLGFEGDVVASYSASLCTLGAETSWNGVWRIECSQGVIVWDAQGVRAGGEAGALEAVELDETVPAGQEAVLAEVVAALAKGRAPETCGRDNLKTLAVAFKTIEASETEGLARF